MISAAASKGKLLDIAPCPAIHFKSIQCLTNYYRQQPGCFTDVGKQNQNYKRGYKTMYTATMIYPVKQDATGDFVKIWEEKILNLAKGQTGFVRMQLLTRDKEIMAIGTWTEKSHAEAFMALGSFKELMAAVKDLLTADPKPTIWNLSAYASR